MADRDEFLDFMEKLDLRGLEGFPLDDSDDDFSEEDEMIPQRKKMKFIMPEIENNFAS